MPATHGEQRHRTCHSYQASYKKPAPLPHAPTFQPSTATLCHFGTFYLYMLNNVQPHYLAERFLPISAWGLPASLHKQAPKLLLKSIGARRFELPTPCSRSRCATKLRYAPCIYLRTETSWAYCPTSHRKMQHQVFSQAPLHPYVPLL